MRARSRSRPTAYEPPIFHDNIAVARPLPPLNSQARRQQFGHRQADPFRPDRMIEPQQRQPQPQLPPTQSRSGASARNRSRSRSRPSQPSRSAATTGGGGGQMNQRNQQRAPRPQDPRLNLNYNENETPNIPHRPASRWAPQDPRLQNDGGNNDRQPIRRPTSRWGPSQDPRLANNTTSNNANHRNVPPPNSANIRTARDPRLDNTYTTSNANCNVPPNSANTNIRPPPQPADPRLNHNTPANRPNINRNVPSSNTALTSGQIQTSRPADPRLNDISNNAPPSNRANQQNVPSTNTTTNNRPPEQNRKRTSRWDHPQYNPDNAAIIPPYLGPPSPKRHRQINNDQSRPPSSQAGNSGLGAPPSIQIPTPPQNIRPSPLAAFSPPPNMPLSPSFAAVNENNNNLAQPDHRQNRHQPVANTNSSPFTSDMEPMASSLYTEFVDDEPAEPVGPTAANGPVPIADDGPSTSAQLADTSSTVPIPMDMEDGPSTSTAPLVELSRMMQKINEDVEEMMANENEIIEIQNLFSQFFDFVDHMKKRQHQGRQ